MSTDFEINDLVWAKMKGYPSWPGKITEPPRECANKSGYHYVYFFGSNNSAWIQDINISYHNEEMLKKAEFIKKKAAVFKKAIDEIIHESNSSNYKPMKEIKSPPHKIPSKASIIAQKKLRAAKKFVKTENKFGGKRSVDALKKLKTKKRKLNEFLPEDKINSTEDISSTSKNNAFSQSLADTQSTHPPKIIKHVTPSTKRIGFLGLGMMGRGIVKNMLNSGHNVTVWNRTAEKCDDFMRAGALKGQTPADVVKSCDIIFCCVSDSDAVQSVVFGHHGVLEGLEGCRKNEKGYVEMTTLNVSYCQEIAEAINLKGCRYLEAPISGSRSIAEEGILIVLGSGDKSLFQDCETCFHAISRHAYFLSHDIGLGSQINLLLTMLAGNVYAAMASSLALLDRMKLPQKEFLEMASTLGLKSVGTDEKAQAMLHHVFAPNTPLKYVQNAFAWGLELNSTQQMHVTSSTNELYKRCKQLGYQEHDVSAVYFGSRI